MNYNAAQHQIKSESSVNEAQLYHPDGDRFGSFSVLTGTHRKQQRSHPVIQMPEVLADLDPTINTWISQAEFSRFNRRLVNLLRVQLQFVDLDYYRIPELRGHSPDNMAWIIEEYCHQEQLPVPSIIVSSGRGLQVKWILDKPLPAQALPRWNAVQKSLVERLAQFGSDPQARDASRVLRVVGTVNQKNGQVCRVVSTNVGTDGDVLRHNFEELCESLLPVARWELEALQEQRRRRRKPRQLTLATSNNTATSSRQRQCMNGRDTSWKRVLDLRKLAELRGGYQEGSRMLHLHWQLNFLLLSGASNDRVMWYEAGELARTIDPLWKYEADSLSTLWQKARDFRAGRPVIYRGREYPALYTPTNDHLINLFEITDGEQRQLTTMVSEQIRQDRKCQRRRDQGIQPRDQFLNQAQDRMRRAVDLKRQGLTRSQIAEQMGVSPDAVKGLIRRAKDKGIS